MACTGPRKGVQGPALPTAYELQLEPGPLGPAASGPFPYAVLLGLPVW